MPETFKAAAQYDDWTGSVAADSDMPDTLQSTLTDRGHLNDGEMLVGMSLFAAGSGFVSISAYIVPAQDAGEALAHLDGSPTPTVRRVDVEISVEEFVGMFKRFSITLSPKAIELEGRELDFDG